MRRKENEPIQKVTLNLFHGDFGKLQDLHGDLGAGRVIRYMVRAYIAKVEKKVAEKQAKVEGQVS